MELDIQGNQRSVTDALGRKVIIYDYDLLQSRIHQSSMEAGQRWMLNDAMASQFAPGTAAATISGRNMTRCAGLRGCPFRVWTP